MKKTILSWVLISSSFMVFAQIDTTRQAMDTTRRDTTNMYNSTNAPRNTDTTGVHNNMNANVSNNAYNAYGAKSVAIPYRAQLNLSKDYPMAANANIAWTQVGEWYHGTYLNNGRYSHIYYDDRGNTWSVALPVTESYVPDDIVSKASTMFGPAIYDLTTLKGDSTHPAIYQIRTIDNGQVKAQWIGDDGNSIMDPFRSDVEVKINTSANAAKDSSNVYNADSARVNAMDSMNMNRNNMDMNRNNMNRKNMDNMNRNNMNNNMNRNNMNNMNRNNMDSSRNRMNNSMDSTGNNMNRDMHNMDSNSHNMMDSSRHSMDSTDHMSSMNMNSSDSTMNNAADSTRNTEGTKMKIKTKNSDGTETKVKVKDGQLKTKED